MWAGSVTHARHLKQRVGQGIKVETVAVEGQVVVNVENSLVVSTEITRDVRIKHIIGGHCSLLPVPVTQVSVDRLHIQEFAALVDPVRSQHCAALLLTTQKTAGHRVRVEHVHVLLWGKQQSARRSGIFGTQALTSTKVVGLTLTVVKPCPLIGEIIVPSSVVFAEDSTQENFCFSKGCSEVLRKYWRRWHNMGP